MKSIFRNKYIKGFSIMLVIDIILIGGWVLLIRPNSSVSIILIFAVPFVFIVNLLLSVIFYFAKREVAKYTAINSLISPVILVVFFLGYIDITLKQDVEKWEFTADGVDYYISYWPEDNDNTYCLLKIDGPEGSSSYDRGNVYTKNDTVYFHSIDSFRYYIYENHLYNFKNIKKIRVSKTY